MRTGLNARLSSIGIREIAGVGQARAVLAVGEARPFSLRERRAADRRLALLRFVHPVVAQHDADIAARFPIGDRFHIEQRIVIIANLGLPARDRRRSEEHTSELQSLMRTSYAFFCLKQKTT